MAEKIPDARLLVLEDAGHCAFLEEHEALDTELVAFASEALGQASTPARRRRGAGTRRLRRS
jgi:hypothetical protein